jgi:hypothetical protein
MIPSLQQTQQAALGVALSELTEVLCHLLEMLKL